MAEGGAQPKEASLKNIGIPKELADEVDRFMEAHPYFGIKFRSDFAARAITHYLATLSEQAALRNNLNLNAAKEGPLSELRKAGVRLPTDRR